MFCPECGTRIPEGSNMCPNCQNKNNDAPNGGVPATKRKKLCCPKCKSRNLQIVSNTEFSSTTKGGGFSASKGCCGYFAFGPLGLLCGSCGSKSETTVTSHSTNVWVCHDCGHKFRDVEEVKKEEENTKKTKKVLYPILKVLCAIFAFDTLFSIFNFTSFVVMLFFTVIFGLVIFFTEKNMDRRIYALQQEREEIENNAYVEE